MWKAVSISTHSAVPCVTPSTESTSSSAASANAAAFSRVLKKDLCPGVSNIVTRVHTSTASLDTVGIIGRIVSIYELITDGAVSTATSFGSKGTACGRMSCVMLPTSVICLGVTGSSSTSIRVVLPWFTPPSTHQTGCFLHTLCGTVVGAVGPFPRDGIYDFVPSFIIYFV
uniref:Uncharacterized protein n=1 Tax=Lygus hesperus TaxID=30085 RepID=A0A146KUA4_LYGHE